MIAAEKGNLATLEVLIEHGAKLDLHSNQGQTALMIAADNAQPDIVDALLKNGAEPNLKDDEDWTALMKAADKNHTATVQALLNNHVHQNSQVKVNAKNKAGLCALPQVHHAN